MSSKDDERIYGDALLRRTRIIEDTAAEVRSILEEGARRIQSILDAQPSEPERWRLSEILAEIRRVLDEIARNAGEIAAVTGNQMETEGLRLVDTGLTAVKLTPPPMIDAPLLRAMREFMTSKIEGITVEAADAINSRLGMVLIGAIDRNTARREIGERLGITQRRAQTILYNETARIYAAATRLRMDQVETAYPGLMRKKWKRSKGRAEPRINHRVIHDQVRKIGEPFNLQTGKGAPLAMQYPHDPAAPIGETINCGCVMVMVPADDSPYAAAWAGAQTDTEDEPRGERFRETAALRIYGEER